MQCRIGPRKAGSSLRKAGSSPCNAGMSRRTAALRGATPDRHAATRFGAGAARGVNGAMRNCHAATSDRLGATQDRHAGKQDRDVATPDRLGATRIVSVQRGSSRCNADRREGATRDRDAGAVGVGSWTLGVVRTRGFLCLHHASSDVIDDGSVAVECRRGTRRDALPPRMARRSKSSNAELCKTCCLDVTARSRRWYGKSVPYRT